VSAPIDLAIAANANVAAPIDAAVAANILSTGSTAQALADEHYDDDHRVEQYDDRDDRFHRIDRFLL
jgi:hypothetical protein